MDTLITDELHGILTTYEMRIELDNPSKGEETFKISKKKTHNRKNNPDRNLEDDEEFHFTKRVQQGTGKYKGNFPSNALTMEKLFILPQNVHTRTQEMIMMELLKTTKEKAGKQTIESFSRRKTISTRRKIDVPPQIKTLKREMMKK